MPYSTATELTSYALARGATLTKDPDVLLTLANDWLETLNFKGIKTEFEQAAEWPRSGVYVQGVLLSDTVVPAQIKKAEMQMALEISAGNLPTEAIASAHVIEESVGSLSTRYASRSSSGSSTVIRSVKPMIADYLEASGGLFVERG